MYVYQYYSDVNRGAQHALIFRSQLIVYFRRDVKVTSEYYLISAISMIAEIGGYASLLLGFSLFNLTELSDWLFEKWQNFLHSFKVLELKKS